jgi:hypothetical protein
MSGVTIGAIALLLCGILSRAHGGFTCTKSEIQVALGPLSIQVQDRERVNTTIWLGVGLVVIGGGSLMGMGRKA